MPTCAEPERAIEATAARLIAHSRSSHRRSTYSLAVLFVLLAPTAAVSLPDDADRHSPSTILPEEIRSPEGALSPADDSRVAEHTRSGGGGAAHAQTASHALSRRDSVNAGAGKQ